MPNSYNGWPASRDKKAIGVVPLIVGGVEFVGGVKGGDVFVVLHYLFTQFHQRVEPLVKGWCWGWAYRQNRNANNLSCHASATAGDANAPRHPNGKRGTFTAAQVREIRKILAELDGLVRWGGDFSGTPDEMHFEIVGTPAQIKALAAHLTQPTVPEDDDMTVIAKPDDGGAARYTTDYMSKHLLGSVAAYNAAKKAGLKEVTVPVALLNDLKNV